MNEIYKLVDALERLDVLHARGEIAASATASQALIALARLAIEARGIVYTDADEFINWSRRFDTTLANLKAGKGASDAC